MFNFEGFTKVEEESIKQYALFSLYSMMDEAIVEEMEFDFIKTDECIFDAVVMVADEDFMEDDPRHFIINIRDTEHDDESYGTMICHEMVHVKQMALNELIESEDMTSPIWKGKQYHMTGTLGSYYSAPWEEEAYGKERGLYHSCVEYYKAINKLKDII